jgi:hypothetical protein
MARTTNPADYPAYFNRSENMKIVLRNARLAFPELFEAKTVNGEGKPAFSCAFLLTPDNPAVKEMLEACLAVAEAKWPGKGKAMYELMKEDKKLAIKNGNSKPDYAGYPGNYFVNARNGARPLVTDREKNPLTAQDGKPYAGCYVNGYIELWAQDNKYGKRINATLRAVQFVKDGDAFSGSSAASMDELEDLGVDNDAPADLV